jgi:hypothetical protein
MLLHFVYANYLSCHCNHHQQQQAPNDQDVKKLKLNAMRMEYLTNCKKYPNVLIP